MNTRPEEVSTPEPEYGADWSRWTRRVAVIILLIGGVFAATLLGSVLSNVVMALILAFALFFPVRAINQRLPFSYNLSVITVFVIYLLVSTFILVNLTTSVLPFISSLFTEGRKNTIVFLEFLEGYEPGDATILGAEGDVANFLETIYGPLSSFVRSFQFESISDALPSLIDTAGVAAGTITGAISSIFLVNLLGLLFLLEIPGMFGWWQAVIQPEYRREIAILLNRVGVVWVGFFRGQIIIAALIGLLTTIQLLVLGITGAVAIGVFTMVVSFIPLLGGFIALIAILLVTLVQGTNTLTVDPVTLITLAIVPNLIMQQIVWNFVAPKITGDAVKLPIPVIILGLIIGAQVGGLLGALLAAPVMGILRVIVEYVLRKIQGGDPYPDEAEPGWTATGWF